MGNIYRHLDRIIKSDYEHRIISLFQNSTNSYKSISKTSIYKSVAFWLINDKF